MNLKNPILSVSGNNVISHKSLLKSEKIVEMKHKVTNNHVSGKYFLKKSPLEKIDPHLTSKNPHGADKSPILETLNVKISS